MRWISWLSAPMEERCWCRLASCWTTKRQKPRSPGARRRHGGNGRAPWLDSCRQPSGGNQGIRRNDPLRACSSFLDGEGITLRLISHSASGKRPIICCHCFRMTVTQYIENLYDRLKDHLHEDYLDLYPVPTTSSLRLGSVFSTLHHNFLESFKLMNSRLPTGETCGVHFWADASRDLIALIDQTEELQTTLKSTELAFSLEPYYLNVIEQCKDFLSPSGGSTIPPQMRKIELYYTQPIFLLKNTISLGRGMEQTACELKLIGEGSYAQVFRYRDLNYDKYFVLKRAKANLNDKELERFKREFEQMKGLNSPYVVEVYRYDDEKKEYLMESMDDTLFHYIQKNNTKLPEEKRKNLCRQVLRAFPIFTRRGYYIETSVLRIFLSKSTSTLW